MKEDIMRERGESFIESQYDFLIDVKIKEIISAF